MGWPVFGSVVNPLPPWVLLFVVLYAAANAPSADIASAAKANADAHKIGDRFISSPLLVGETVSHS